MGLFNFLPERKLSIEAFSAYYHRLPKRIQVSWFRDGKMIVGEVSDGKKRFMTQGRNADDFIFMVNDALMTIYDIPKEYCEVISRSIRFLPNHREREKLENLDVKRSKFGINKIAEKELVTA